MTRSHTCHHDDGDDGDGDDHDEDSKLTIKSSLPCRFVTAICIRRKSCCSSTASSSSDSSANWPLTQGQSSATRGGLWTTWPPKSTKTPSGWCCRSTCWRSCSTVRSPGESGDCGGSVARQRQVRHRPSAQNIFQQQQMTPPGSGVQTWQSTTRPSCSSPLTASGRFQRASKVGLLLHCLTRASFEGAGTFWDTALHFLGLSLPRATVLQ